MSTETGLRVAVRMTEYVVGISLMVAGEVPAGAGVDTGTGVRTEILADLTAVVVREGDMVATGCGRDDEPGANA
jgi:hypothetical protein